MEGQNLILDLVIVLIYSSANCSCLLPGALGDTHTRLLVRTARLRQVTPKQTPLRIACEAPVLHARFTCFT